jgi:hypothetical protein
LNSVSAPSHLERFGEALEDDVRLLEGLAQPEDGADGDAAEEALQGIAGPAQDPARSRTTLFGLQGAQHAREGLKLELELRAGEAVAPQLLLEAARRDHPAHVLEQRLDLSPRLAQPTGVAGGQPELLGLVGNAPEELSQLLEEPQQVHVRPPFRGDPTGRQTSRSTVPSISPEGSVVAWKTSLAFSRPKRDRS